MPQILIFAWFLSLFLLVVGFKAETQVPVGKNICYSLHLPSNFHGEGQVTTD